MVKNYEVTSEQFLNKFIELLSVIQNDGNKFTKKQTQILVEFLMLDNEKYAYTRFMGPGKREVIKRIKDKYGRVVSRESMSIFLKMMEKRGILVADEDRVRYISKGIKKYLDTALKSEEPIEITFRFVLKK